MSKAILKLDGTTRRITKTLNTQLVVADKLLWESRKGKTVIIAGGIRLGETEATGTVSVKMVIKSQTYETTVEVPADAKKIIIHAKLTGMQKFVSHFGFLGKGFVTSSLLSGKGVKFTAKAK